MNIDVVITDSRHPLRSVVSAWGLRHSQHALRLLERLADADGGDRLVLVACHEIAKPEIRGRYGRCMVTHASDLPEGRGWSPAIWDVLGGQQRLVLSLIEAAEPIDSGRIFQKFRASLRPTDLHDDIIRVLGQLVLEALDFVVENPDAEPSAQVGEPTWYRRRNPEDSRLDPTQSIEAQFNLLRVCDPERYPAFFELHGERFEVVVRRALRIASQ